MSLYLKHQSWKTSILERNEGMHIETTHNPLHTIETLFFHAFQST